MNERNRFRHVAKWNLSGIGYQSVMGFQNLMFKFVLRHNWRVKVTDIESSVIK